MIGANPTVGNPVSLLSYVARRSWTPTLPASDPRYYTPQCNLNSPAANGDCGALDNTLFGQLRPSAAIDPKTYSGWGNRPWNQEAESPDCVDPRRAPGGKIRGGPGGCDQHGAGGSVALSRSVPEPNIAYHDGALPCAFRGEDRQ